MALTKATYSMISGAPANVFDFGATGDGSTDDTSAIQSAIDSVSSLGGDVIFPVPSVAYKTTTTLTLPIGVRLIGQGAPLRWRNTKTPVVIKYYGSTACISVVAPASTVVDAGQIINLQIDGENAQANTDGLVLNATASGSAIEGFYSQNLTITNFPRYQYSQVGEVFDITHNNLSALNPERVADNIINISGSVSSQITFNDCWLVQYTGNKWCVYKATGGIDLRFYGGTVAPYASSPDANGIYNYGGGLYLYGTHVEGIGATANSIGIQYIGSSGAFISPSQCNGFGTNIRIGDSTSAAARGWVISGNVGPHISGGSGDVQITSGGSRYGTVLDLGYSDGTGIISNDRYVYDGVAEVNDFYGTVVVPTLSPQEVMRPQADNYVSCGTASYRWSTVYAATGTINTSDENEKTDIEPLDYKEKAVALAIKARIKKFKFKDAVEAKGNKARIHFGVMAQDVKAAFEAEGLNADDYGVFCSDTLEDGSVRLGVRYDELFAFILGAA